MSLQSWKAEFYPRAIDDNYGNKVSWVQAVQHSILKWTGVSKENLERHGLVKDVGITVVRPASAWDDLFIFAEDTCALCAKADSEGDCDPRCDACRNCPLAAVGAMCENADSPYCRWVKCGNNDSMLLALNRALELVKEEDKVGSEAMRAMIFNLTSEQEQEREEYHDRDY